MTRPGTEQDQVGDPALWSVGDGELTGLVRGLETQGEEMSCC